jgi:hypothetical protein
MKPAQKQLKEKRRGIKQWHRPRILDLQNDQTKSGARPGAGESSWAFSWYSTS